MIVPPLPGQQDCGCRAEGVKGGLAPELLVVNAVTAFDFAVLLRPMGLDVAEANPRSLHGQPKGQGAFGAVVDLDLLDDKGEGLSKRFEEVEAGRVIFRAIEPEDAIAGAIIEGGVLEASLSRDLQFLHVHMDTVTRVRPTEERQLTWSAFRGPADRRIVAAAMRIRWTRSNQIRVRIVQNSRSRRAGSMRRTVCSEMRRGRVAG